MRSLGDGMSGPGDDPDEAHDAVLATTTRNSTGRIIDPRWRAALIRYAGLRGLQETGTAPSRT